MTGLQTSWNWYRKYFMLVDVYEILVLKQTFVETKEEKRKQNYTYYL